MTDAIVYAEVAAYQLLYGKGGDTNLSSADFHDAGDKIILLAEKVKAERTTAAMKLAEIVKGKAK